MSPCESDASHEPTETPRKGPTVTSRVTKTAGLGAAMMLTLSLAACGGGDSSDAASGGDAGSVGGELSGSIAIDGSSTVAPLSEAAAELFMQEQPGVSVTVGTSGTGGGFEKFCRGETDMNDASREIKDEEIAMCEEAGIKYEKVNVSNDGLAVVVNPENDWAACMSVDELKKMWEPNAKTKTWKDVNADFPAEAFKLYGPGSDSGTFDYFTDAVNGEEGAIRSDYSDIGEDDNAAVTGVSGDRNAMAFIPLSFVIEAGDKVKAIEIENDKGDCVAPSEETVQDSSYNPLGRQLYVYPSDKALAKPEVLEFLQFYIDKNDEIAEAAGFIPLTDEQKDESLKTLESLSG